MSLAGAATSIIFVATEVRLPRQTFCCDEIMFVVTKLLMQQIFVLTNMCLSRQAYFCCDKGCVFLRQTRVCHKCSVTTKIHLSQQNLCHNKHTFVVTKDAFFCDKRVFVTNVLSQQKYICHNKTFVTKSILLL